MLSMAVLTLPTAVSTSSISPCNVVNSEQTSLRLYLPFPASFAVIKRILWLISSSLPINLSNDSDYENLHLAMKGQGFFRTISADDGKIYKLPTAEYNIPNTNLDKNAILNKAKTAAASTGKEFEVLVTDSNGRTWYNLPIVGSMY